MTTSKSITEQVTTGQVRQFRRFCDDAIEKFVPEVKKMSKQSLQQLIANGGEFQRRVIMLIRKLSKRNVYANEECDSTVGYYSGYKRPISIPNQVKILQGLIPGLGEVNQEYLAKIKRGEIRLPKFAEGWFVIPNWQKHSEIFGKTYASAVQKVLDLLRRSRNDLFCNYRDGIIDDKHFRQTAESKQFFAKLIEEQENPDVLIVPAQFGIVHRGKSVRRVRVIFVNNKSGEFGLGAFHVGMMLLTHPDRLKHYYDLFVDCAGDEFSLNGDKYFVNAPFFIYEDGELGFDASGVNSYDDDYGSASVFPVIRQGGSPQ